MNINQHNPDAKIASFFNLVMENSNPTERNERCMSSKEQNSKKNKTFNENKQKLKPEILRSLRSVNAWFGFWKFWTIPTNSCEFCRWFLALHRWFHYHYLLSFAVQRIKRSLWAWNTLHNQRTKQRTKQKAKVDTNIDA